MKKILFSPFLTLLPLIALAYDVKLDGIYYNISGDEAEVTSSNNNTTEYTGVVVIPESVTYHNKTYSVTSIGTSAFAKSSNLISVTIPESVTKIGGSAFLGCSSLTSVTIPESVTSIGHWAFQGCRSLTSLTIPNGLTIIDQGVFSSCTSLKSVNIPECVTSIGGGAFNDCGSLASVTIPNGVTSIENGAFHGCRSLKSITIPEGITRIGFDTFKGCRSLTTIIIPNGVTNIECEAFMDCSGLASVTIPNSVTNIEDGAFQNCRSLTDVYCYAPEPPSVSTTEYDGEVWDGFPFGQYYIEEHTTLHVPASSLEKYKTALRWSDFSNIVAIEEPRQPLPFLEGNPIWVFKHESLSHPEDDPLMCWLAGNRNFTYYFLGGQKEIEGKVYTMMGAVGCNRDGEITLNHWLPVREENGIVYAFTDSLPGIIETEDNYDSRYNDEYNPMPYLQQGNECVLYNFSTNIGETLYPQNEGSTVKAFDTYQLLDGTECHVLKTNWGRYDLYEKLGFLSDDFDGIMDPFLSWPMPTDGSVHSSRLNAYYQDNVMLYKAADAPEGLCVNDTCWTRDEAHDYAITYKADPYHEKVMSYIRQLQGIAEPIIFTEGQMATIILPTEPDASKGKFYRLDRVEEGKIVFEQELQPHAHVPYIIVPNEDFSIDLNNMDLEGCSPDTVSIKVRFEGQEESQSIYFIGSYVSEELEQQEGCNIQFIDTTPDCSISFSEETGKRAFLIGALRAYLTWDDPIDHGGAKGRGDMEIVLRDYGTSIEEMKNEELRSFSSTKSMKNDVFDLSGRKIVNGTPRRQSRLGSKESKNLPQGIYIENGVKKVTKQ